MTVIRRFTRRANRIWRERGIFIKAVSYAVIGLINVGVDAVVFFIGYFTLTSWPAAQETLGGISQACGGCVTTTTATLITANVCSWIVAVSGSYVMNSHITFALETGRQLRWRSYAKFVVTQIVGITVSTTVLVTAAKVMPVWQAKGLAILVSFLVNFTLTNFIVFRTRRPTPIKH